MKLKKYFVGLVAFAFLYGCVPPFEPSAADPQICSSYNEGDEEYKKFLCVGSDIKRSYNAYTTAEQAGNKESGNWCSSKKYGHTFVLVDSTEGYEEEQYALLLNQFFDEANVELVGPYDKVSILAIDGRGKQATELEPLMSECKPPSGKPTMWPHDSYVDSSTTDNRIKATYRRFSNKLVEAGEQFANLGDTTGEYSQLIEQVKELSRNNKLDFGSDYEYRKIVIFSDLMQFSDNVDLIASCRNKKKCVSYEDMKNQMNERLWENLKPSWGTKKPEVYVYYLQCRHDQGLDIGLLDIWQSYFDELGMKMTYDIETSCEDIEKKSKDPEV